MKIQKKKIVGVGLGWQGGCEQRKESFVKNQKNGGGGPEEGPVRGDCSWGRGLGGCV